MAARITLLSRPGCHLCDDAREVITRVARDLGACWEERDITRSEADLAEYWDKIPVTLVDGVQHDFWRVSEDRLRAALRKGPSPQLSAATDRDFPLPGVPVNSGGDAGCALRFSSPSATNVPDVVALPDCPNRLPFS